MVYTDEHGKQLWIDRNEAKEKDKRERRQRLKGTQPEDVEVIQQCIARLDISGEHMKPFLQKYKLWNKYRMSIGIMVKAMR